MNLRLRQFLDSLTVPDADGCWRPPVDVYQSPDGWLIKIDLAGVRPEDLQIQFRGQQLEVCGYRRDLSLVRGHQAYSMEIAYNRFHRIVNLPCQIEHADVHSVYQDGMLLITIVMGGAET